MKKTFKFLAGLIIVYIMVYSCNRRLSSKYQTNFRHSLEKEKKEKLLKENELQSALDLDTIVNNSTVDDIPKEIEKKPGDKSFEEFEEIFNRAATADREYQSDELTGFQPGTTTSASQLQKASQAPAGKFNMILNEKK